MSNFTTIAPTYQQTATLQKSASERLFDMLDISRTDNVLDLGCGTGHITQTIRLKTEGSVVGVDPSEGMVAEARRTLPDDIEFHVGSAEGLDMPERFDAIFCNSTFQWFRDPSRAVFNCYKALRSGGRLAIQAPARSNYCPAFVLATQSLGQLPGTRDCFAHFRSPWFFLESADAYAEVLSSVGFSVLASEIEEVAQYCTPTSALEAFESGAAAGYLNPECYEAPLSSNYVATAREAIAASFRAQAGRDGQVELKFFRVYLLARKP